MRLEKPTTLDACKLLQDGCVALAQVESNGMRVDTEYLKDAIKSTSKQIIDLMNAIKKDEVVKVWKKRFGVKTNLDSGDQLGKVLFEDMGYECPVLTEGGKPKTDEGTLERLDIEFVKKYLQIKKLKKAKNTYLIGIAREVCDGFIHPVFNLHLARTFRSSSDSPNFQNMPIRNPEIGKLIRRCFIPREGGHIVECDYGGIEVKIAYCYHKDPVMKSYLDDPTKDMHRDMAQQCYALPLKEVTNPVDKDDEKRIKSIRYCGKNMFVFPQFYGDWYLSCASALWEACEQMKLHLRDGTSVRDWLRKKGIRELGSLNPKERPVDGTFVYHLSKVEDDFWNNRFRVYKQWKDEWEEAYRRTGKFSMLTGFEINSLLKKNQVINSPVQGAAFHCLLWSLIRLQKILNKRRMKSLIVGQIHDSIVADVPHEELQDYLSIAKQVMTQDIRKAWKWIITNLEVEAEASPLDRSWYEKEKVKI